CARISRRLTCGISEDQGSALSNQASGQGSESGIRTDCSDARFLIHCAFDVTGALKLGGASVLRSSQASTLKAPGPARAMWRNTKLNRIAASPPLTAG